MATLGDKAYFGVGTNLPTLKSVIFAENEPFAPLKSISEDEFVDALVVYNGDGTVPFDSATMMGLLPETMDGEHYRAFNQYSHMEMAGSGNVMKVSEVINESSCLSVGSSCPATQHLHRYTLT